MGCHTLLSNLYILTPVQGHASPEDAAMVTVLISKIRYFIKHGVSGGGPLDDDGPITGPGPL